MIRNAINISTMIVASMYCNTTLIILRFFFLVLIFFILLPSRMKRVTDDS